jgi:hypothetical protein
MDIDIISDEFRLQQANRYSLWLYLSDNDCSFVILDDTSKLFVGIKRVSHISLTKTIELFDELSAIPFSRVSIALDAQPSLMIPGALFRQENKRNLLAFTAEFNEEHEVIEQFIPFLSMVNLFAVAPSFKSFIAPYFPKANLIHTSSAMLIAAANLSRSVDSNPTIGIRITDNNLYVCVFDSGKLILSNSFAIKTCDDIVYWLLRLCEQFGFPTSKVRIYFQGVDNLLDERIVVLKQHFAKLNLLPFPDMFQLTPEIKAEAKEIFTDLFYLPICEL